MATFNIKDLDTHIQNLQAQLTFLASSLEASDHTDPEWLPSDLIRMKGKASMLYDDMRRVRKKMIGEGVWGKKESNKRLSIEGGEAVATSNKRARTSAPESATTSRRERSAHQDSPSAASSAKQMPADPEPVPEPAPEKANNDDYEVQYVDITEEVNRRLRESRLRTMMDSPSTSQKRKFDDMELRPTDSNNDGGDVEEEDELDLLRSPMKKQKTIGHYEPVGGAVGMKRSFSNSERMRRIEERAENKKRRKI